MTDFRALCAELVEAWDTNAEWDCDKFDVAVESIVFRARAGLAKPEIPAESPTDEELTLTYALAVASAVDGLSKPWPADVCEQAQLAGLRAVLARWGNQ